MPCVLLVEDNKQLASLTELMLAELNHECVHVEGVAEAIAALSSRQIDVIVTDFRLPDGNGADLSTHAAERPIVVLSGYDVDDLPAEKFPPRTIFKTKPLSFEDLDRVIKQALKA